jgi:DNA polymerase-3 subunit chi
MKIDFHILENANQQQAWLYTCKLIEQAYTDKQAVYIYTNNVQESEKLDKLLWTYSDNAFIPHLLADEKNDVSPVQIGHGAPPSGTQNLLINLSAQVPAFYKEFDHAIEIVFSDPSVQQLARERYKKYRENGDELNTIKQN